MPGFFAIFAGHKKIYTMKHITLLVSSLLLLTVFQACDKNEEETTPQDQGLTGVNVAAGEKGTDHSRVYVLSEGNMGANSASLDLFTYSDGYYYRNIFGTINAEVALGLGDTGNDLEVGPKGWLWATMTGSDLIEIMKPDATHVTSIKVSQPRCIAFDDGYAYVTSYNADSNENGKLYKIDAHSLRLVDSLLVGRHPEGLAVCDGKIYVTNSYYTTQEDGAKYATYHYLNTVDVIGVDGFRLLSKIEAGTNLKDATVEDDKVFVGALGNYYDVPAGVWCIDPSSGKAVEVKGAGYSILTGGDDKVYSLSVDYSESKAHVLYSIDPETLSVTRLDIQKLSSLSIPYGLGVDEGHIFISDAVDYNLSPSLVHCYNLAGRELWKATSGVFSGHFAFN